MKNESGTADILKKAREGKTSDDFNTVIATLEQMIGELRNRRQSIEAEREAAVFGDGNLATVRRASAEVDQDIETLQAALSGARRRRDESVKVEQAAKLEQAGVAVKAMADEYREAIRLFHNALSEAREANARMEKLRLELDNKNDILTAQGRRDLCIMSFSVQGPFLADVPRLPVSGLSRTRAGFDNDATLRTLFHSIRPRNGSVANGFVPYKPLRHRGRLHAHHKLRRRIRQHRQRGRDRPDAAAGHRERGR
jgi:tetratricopeptide (TPR) repeat protein